jgi:uncharacterized protein (TIGR02452 family)
MEVGTDIQNSPARARHTQVPQPSSQPQHRGYFKSKSVIGGIAVVAMACIGMVWFFSRNHGHALKPPLGNDTNSGVVNSEVDSKAYKLSEICALINNPVPATISISNKTTLEAAQEFADTAPDSHIMLVNFANAEAPGGAQEGSLTSGLGGYAAALQKHMTNNDYPLYKNPENPENPDTTPETTKFIITQGVTLPNGKQVSVMAAAALHVKSTVTQQMAQKHASMCIPKMLDAASVHNVDCLILGAWGCGIFENDPTTMAEAFMNAIETHPHNVPRICFAIPQRNDGNYDVFNKVLRQKPKKKSDPTPPATPRETLDELQKVT